jgi:hypothetical protein
VPWEEEEHRWGVPWIYLGSKNKASARVVGRALRVPREEEHCWGEP